MSARIHHLLTKNVLRQSLFGREIHSRNVDGCVLGGFMLVIYIEWEEASIVTFVSFRS